MYYGIAGLACTGKREVGNIICDETGYEVIETEDILESMARDEYCYGLNNKQLGYWFSEDLEENREELYDRIDRKIEDKEGVIITGLRVKKDYSETIKDKENCLIYVESPFGERYNRFKRRENIEIGPEELASKDLQEIGWGSMELRSEADHVIQNCSSLEDLEQKVLSIL